MSQRSNCCLAPVRYECKFCGEPCDIDSPSPSALPDELGSYDSIKMFKVVNQIISYLKSRE